jgi:hypothetical protein
MFMPVESLLRLKQSAIYDTSSPQRRLTINIRYLRSHLRRRGRCARFVGFVLWCLVFGVVYPPDTRGERRRSNPKAPEVVMPRARYLCLERDEGAPGATGIGPNAQGNSRRSTREDQSGRLGTRGKTAHKYPVRGVCLGTR